MTFALVTARDIHPNGPEEDDLIIAALKARGAKARTVVWRETDPTSLGGQNVIIRTPWDYCDHYESFVTWLKTVDQSGATLINPLDHLLGTINKTYLADFAARGFAVPDTIVCNNREALEAALAEAPFEDAIIKPVVGGSAIGLQRINPGAPASWSEIDFTLPQLLQPFLPEIETAGEISFVFFGGTFSHAVRKKAKPGDIRVQVDWGGTVEVVDPPHTQITEAAHFLTALPSTPAYARVDVVEAGGTLLLMELEVIEPELFCLYVPRSAERFADVLLAF